MKDYLRKSIPELHEVSTISRNAVSKDISLMIESATTDERNSSNKHFTSSDLNALFFKLMKK
jgi:hypothetical protein